MRQTIHKHRLLINLAFCVLVFLIFLSPLADAQAKPPSAILNQYRGQRTTWFTAVWPFANNLFGLLATIEFAWSAALMLLEKSDMQSWTSALVRKMMWLGAFYALLIYGRYWIPAITDSFELIGQTAAGTGPMSPSDIFTRGIDLAGALMSSASGAAFFTNIATSIMMVLTGIITALAFIAITVQFVVAMVESYIIVAAGFVFVGFGGSRWTAPYVERYIGLGVATGVKIMLLYLLIGVGMDLSTTWMTDAQNIPSAATPAMSALEIMGASIIFMMLCWQIPKLFAAVLGGSPALSGGDLVSSTSFVAGGAMAVASMGATALGAASGGVASLGKMVAGALTETPKSTAVPPPPPTTPPSGSTQPLAPLGQLRNQIRSQVPPDSGPHAAPPRMNIDPQE